MHEPMSAKCQKRTSNKLKLSYLFFSWAVLQALELADDPRITFTIALHGKHAREMHLEEFSPLPQHQPWGGGIIRTTGRCASRPYAKGERGRAFARRSPLECCHHRALSLGLFVAFTGRFIHGNRV